MQGEEHLPKGPGQGKKPLKFTFLLLFDFSRGGLAEEITIIEHT